MKLTPFHKLELYGKEKPSIWRGNNAHKLLLLPLLWVELPISDQLLVWILVAIAAAIVVLFILIAFILLPLSRRTADQNKKHKPTQIETQPSLKAVSSEADEVDTAPVPPPKDQEIKETVLSMPVITVGQPLTTPISGDRSPDIHWQIAGLSDVGLRRELNEDCMLLIEDEMNGLGYYGLYIVADGLGGHEAGEVASQLTVDTIRSCYIQNPPTANQAPFEAWLKDTATFTNEVVIKHQADSPENSKMGSTLVMALVTGQLAYIINVGDSRAYHLTHDNIKQISVDHSLVERLVQIGQITREEARTHPKKNVVYSIIGEKRRLEIGYYQALLNPGDRLLLCSDGLSDMIDDDEILHISKHQPDPGKASQMMVEAAKHAGGNDNITMIIVQMDE